MNSNSSWDDGDAGKQIGTNLRQFRKNKGISIEGLAKQIGVSKLTLIKIENGEGNPTLSVIWKIANGLNVPVSTLLSVDSDVSVARKEKGLQLASSDEVLVAEPLFQSRSSMELYRGYLKPDSAYLSEAHPSGVMEYVTVMTGELIMEMDGEAYHLREHDSIRFAGNRTHKYINPTDSLTTLHFVISYNHL
ncbi:helix-turn-helix domain-containing protein [Bacillus sp. Marseille-Q3570]|uniref:helix-turn-helix domain-containing protein n=1 Tax=Bacillus sp. Marseille-Q3570 TaxID=2963522 RepID=UPI0021B805F6|nr:XRE family transcriptional regulator [Bacillus sp. Marseille-Q3570]